MQKRIFKVTKVQVIKDNLTVQEARALKRKLNDGRTREEAQEFYYRYERDAYG